MSAPLEWHDSSRVTMRCRLASLLDEADLPALSPDQTEKFETYYALLLRWNAKVNLTAIRDEEGILSRHFVESIACAAALPQEIATLLDFGAGGGFPGVPIAICRPKITVTLAESQGRKAAFLREVCRALGSNTTVHAARAEDLASKFDCVTLRAVDRMADAVTAASRLVRPNGWLVVMTTTTEIGTVHKAAGRSVRWSSAVPIHGRSGQVISLGLMDDQ